MPDDAPHLPSVILGAEVTQIPWPEPTSGELAGFNQDAQEIAKAAYADMIRQVVRQLNIINFTSRNKSQYAKTYRRLQHDLREFLAEHRTRFYETDPPPGIAVIAEMRERVVSRQLEIMRIHFKTVWHEDLEATAGDASGLWGSLSSLFARIWKK